MKMMKRLLALCLSAFLLLGTALLPVSAVQYKIGDVDDNGETEVTDARCALRAAVGLENYAPGSREFLAADIDGNGEIEVSDARDILRAAVGLVTLTPPVREPDAPADYDAIPDEAPTADDRYALAYVTDSDTLKDGAFNESAWNGVKSFAAAHGESYKYYAPASAFPSDEDLAAAIADALDHGARIVTVTGFFFENALTAAAEAHPDVRFIYLDGYPLNDAQGSPLKNVLPITFRAADAGFLAGYAAVADGKTKLGFSGAGSGDNPAVNAYGFGFLQGANTAAKERGVRAELRYTYLYADTFSANPELEALLTGWFREDGVQAVMSCGGGIIESAVNAAQATDGKVIAVDVDASLSYGDVVLTSAVKDCRAAVNSALGLCLNGDPDAYAGTGYAVGLAEGAVCLPEKTWSMTGFTREDYFALLSRTAEGAYEISDDVSALKSPAYATDLDLIICE